MLLSLAAIMLHQSCDWTCCRNKSSLVKNMASVVKGITSTTLSSLQGSHEVLQLASIEKVLKKRAMQSRWPAVHFSSQPSCQDKRNSSICCCYSLRGKRCHQEKISETAPGQKWSALLFPRTAAWWQLKLR